MSIKVFADGANISSMKESLKEGLVHGFTTNPSLMVKDGVEDYLSFAQDCVAQLGDVPISFEVFSDNLSEMHKQAVTLSQLGSNVYVKIPVTNTKGVPTYGLIADLSYEGVKINATALFTLEQVKMVFESLYDSVDSIISVFAGRIADTLIDPEQVMKASAEIVRDSRCELLWASTREIFNVVQAERCGADIITVPDQLLKKLDLKGKCLNEYSLETVKMFFDDACKAGYSL